MSWFIAFCCSLGTLVLQSWVLVYWRNRARKAEQCLRRERVAHLAAGCHWRQRGLPPEAISAEGIARADTHL